MRWRIGNYTFDKKKKRVNGSQETRLNSRQVRLLEFLIEHYDQAYKDKQLISEAWEGYDASGSLYKYINVLRDALGGKGKSLRERKEIIGTDPYRLLIKPELLDDDRGAVINIPDVPKLDQPKEVHSFGKNDFGADAAPFSLVVDGMVIDAVCELLKYDDSMISVINQAHRTYKRCIEDFAFALVYGTSVITNSNIVNVDNDPRRYSRRWLISQLGDLWQIHLPGPDLIRGAILKTKVHRPKLVQSMEAVSRCIERDGWAFRDWLSGEITRHLGDHPSLFEERRRPEDLEFRSPVMKYYTDADLQGLLTERAMDRLVRYMMTDTVNRPQQYPVATLREFLTRNVLALVTIMHENDESARRRKATRLPHLLRCLTQQEVILSTATPQQVALRSLTVQHALAFVLSHIEDIHRETLISQLLNLREIHPFKKIREILQDSGLFLSNPRASDEPKAAAVHRRILHLVTHDRLVPDNVLPAEHAAIRQLWTGVDAIEYQRRLYSVFPALEPPPVLPAR